MTLQTLVESVSFRDSNGRLHRWRFAKVSPARDGRAIITRLNEDGSWWGSTTRKPGQYFVVPEAIIRRSGRGEEG